MCSDGRRNKAKQSFHGTVQQTTATARAHNPEALGVRRREIFHATTQFREGYRKIPHESRKTRELSNATMSKHSDDESDDFSLLTNLSLCRTLNLTILNAFPGNCVLNCVEIESLQWYITRDIDCQSFRTLTCLTTARYDDFFRMIKL